MIMNSFIGHLTLIIYILRIIWDYLRVQKYFINAFQRDLEREYYK